MSSLDDCGTPESRTNMPGLRPPNDADPPGASIAEELVGRIAELDAIAWNLPGGRRELLLDDPDPEPAA
jgi:hypothetical protein